VNALERALRQCLFALYPEIAAVHMMDYHVKPLEPAQGTMSRARVACTWSDGNNGLLRAWRRILWKPRGWPWWTASGYRWCCSAIVSTSARVGGFVVGCVKPEYGTQNSE